MNQDVIDRMNAEFPPPDDGGRLLHYDFDGRPIGLGTWAALFDDCDARVVAQDYPAREIKVSTVWLGLDHSFGHGPPLIFETMVFGGPLDQEMRRYTTWAEAEAGHVQMVRAAWSWRHRILDALRGLRPVAPW